MLRRLARLLIRTAAITALGGAAMLTSLALDAGMHISPAPDAPENAPENAPRAFDRDAVRAGPLPPLPKAIASLSSVQHARSVEIPALGVRMRMAQQDGRRGYLVVNVVSGAAPLRAGDFLLGLCETSQPITEDLSYGACLHLIRGGVELDVKT